MDYRAAMAEWMSILGRPAMLPRSAFGVWWSRYYRYSEETIVSEVLDGYRNHSIPLNALVMDMGERSCPAAQTHRGRPGCRPAYQYQYP